MTEDEVYERFRRYSLGTGTRGRAWIDREDRGEAVDPITLLAALETEVRSSGAAVGRAAERAAALRQRLAAEGPLPPYPPLDGRFSASRVRDASDRLRRRLDAHHDPASQQLRAQLGALLDQAGSGELQAPLPQAPALRVLAERALPDAVEEALVQWLSAVRPIDEDGTRDWHRALRQAVDAARAQRG